MLPPRATPEELIAGVPEPLKRKVAELLYKTPEQIKHDEFLAKRREQWRRRKERKEQEALERDGD